MFTRPHFPCQPGGMYGLWSLLMAKKELTTVTFNVASGGEADGVARVVRFTMV
jgi:hypothetical protein